MAERATLAGGVFEQHHRLDARPGFERHADCIRNQPQRLVVRSGRARAGMNDDAEQAQRLGAIDLVDEGCDRLLAQRRECRGEIDQVAGVRDHGCDSRLLDALPESLDFAAVQGLTKPLIRVLREDLQGLASVDDRALDGLRDAAGNGHVRADSKHSINIITACEPLFSSRCC